MPRTQTSVSVDQATVEEARRIARRLRNFYKGKPNVSAGVRRMAEFHRWARSEEPELVKRFHAIHFQE